MKLRAIRLRDVKKFGSDGLAIEGVADGLSVLAAPNEFGKSTLFDAIRTALFNKHSSKAQHIADLQPRTGGAPEIELDLEFDGRPYRLHKRFLKRAGSIVTDLATREIVAKDGVADDWTLEKIGAVKPSEGPTGLLWVEQGKSMAQPDGGEAGGALLSDLLEREVGQVVGGDRARAFLAKATADLDVLVTSKSANPRGPYKAAIDARDSAAAETEALSEKLNASESILHDLAETDRQLEAFDDPEETVNLAAKLKAAEATLEAAREAAGKLELLQQKYQSAKMTADAEKQKLDRRLEAQQNASTLAAEASALKRNLDDAEEVYRDASKIADEASETKDAAQTVRKLAADDDVRMRKALVARDAKEKLAQREDQLKRARTIDSDLRAKRAELGANQITPEKRNEIEDLSRRRDIAKSVLNAMRPVLTADLEPAAAGKVRVNGVPVVSGDERVLAGQADIAIEDIGRLVVRAPDPADAARDFDAAEERLTEALTETGVEALAEVEALALARHTIDAEIATLEAQYNDLAPDGLEALEDLVADLKVQTPDEKSEDFDQDEVERALEEANSNYEKARDNLDEAVAARNAAQIAAAEIKAEHKNLQSQYDALIANLGPEETWGAVEKTLKEQYAAAETGAEVARRKLAEAEEEAPDIKTAEIDVQRFSEAKANRDAGRQAAREEQIRLRTELKSLESEGVGEKLADAKAELEMANIRVASYEDEIAALRLLIDALTKAQETLQQAFFKPVAEQLQPLLRLVLDGAEIGLGDSFQAETLRRSDIAESIDTLSGGTREQIAVLTRLAFAQLMARRDRPAPVFLDDALVFCDDRRLEAMFRALHAASQDVQCIVLTCHQRAFADLGGKQLNWSAWSEQ